MQLLHGHVSPATAYIIDDYPYSFQLRCKMRCWMEYSKTYGVRMMRQTSDPKAMGLVWNNAKAGTYSRFGGAMYLDDNGQLQFDGMHEYMDGAKCAEWRDKFGAACHPAAVDLMTRWVAAKQAYDAKSKSGADMRTSATAGLVAFTKVNKE